MDQIIYYVPRISTKHGEDVTDVYESLDDAVASVAAYCRDWWSDAEAAAGWGNNDDLLNEEGELPLPGTDDEIIKLYFELVENEYYEIHQTTFHPTWNEK